MIDVLSRFVEDVEAGVVPDCFPSISWMDHDALSDCMEGRRKCTRLGMWAIVDMSWTAKLAEFIGERKVLEIMAGAGWLAKALESHGVDIVATDSGTWAKVSSTGYSRHSTQAGGKAIYPVLEVEAVDAIESVMADILIVSWPPLGDTRILKALDAWGEERPVIYIGEGFEGCCACDEFFKRFIEGNSIHIKMPKWDCIHDYLSVGRWTKGG